MPWATGTPAGCPPEWATSRRLLNDYYPHTNEPATLTNLNQKAAAVQAAIWFFSDRYVLSTADPLHDAVVAIVNEGQSRRAAHPAATAQPHHRSTESERARRERGRTVHGRPPVPGSGGGGGRALPREPSSPLRAEPCTPTRLAQWRSLTERRSRLGSRSGCAPRLVRPPPCSRPKRRPPSPAATSISTTATTAGVQRRPAAHPGRECDVDDHRHSHRQFLSRRLAGSQEDDRRSRCRLRRGLSSSTWPAPMARTGPTSAFRRVPPQATRQPPITTFRPERCAPSPRHPTAATRQRRWW